MFLSWGDTARGGSYRCAMDTANAPALPAEGFIRESQLIGRPKATPPVPGILPISHGTLWAWCKSGRFPAPVKLGPSITAWRVEDVRCWIAQQGAR